MKTRKTGLILCMTALVFASGCVDLFSTNQRIQDDADQIREDADNAQWCSSVSLNIVDVSENTAIIQQDAGNAPAGEVTVEWTYNNGETDTTTSTISSAREVIEAEPGSTVNVDSVVAYPSDCPSYETTYP